MPLWWVLSTILAMAVAVPTQNCSEQCNWCRNGICIECEIGYQGPNCEPCPTNCLHGKCFTNYTCVFGCERGWYGIICDKKCGCGGAICHQHLGECFDMVFCVEGVCSEGCEQFCPAETSNEETEVLFSEIYVFIAVLSLVCLVSCFCWLIKKGSKNEGVVTTTETFEIIPFSQKLLPGSTPSDFQSSNKTFSHSSLATGYLEQTNSLTLPCEITTPTSYPTSGVNSYVIQADIPPLPKDHDKLPSYDSLFKASNGVSDK